MSSSEKRWIAFLIVILLLVIILILKNHSFQLVLIRLNISIILSPIKSKSCGKNLFRNINNKISAIDNEIRHLESLNKNASEEISTLEQQKKDTMNE